MKIERKFYIPKIRSTVDNFMCVCHNRKRRYVDGGSDKFVYSNNSIKNEYLRISSHVAHRFGFEIETMRNENLSFSWMILRFYFYKSFNVFCTDNRDEREASKVASEK